LLDLIPNPVILENVCKRRRDAAAAMKRGRWGRGICDVIEN